MQLMNHTIPAAAVPIIRRVAIPGSKSMTYRALMIAALADGASELSDIYINNNILTFVNVLHALGFMIQLDKANRTCIIGGNGGKIPKTEASLFLNGAQVPTKYLLAACAGTNGTYTFDGEQSLRDEPLGTLLNTLVRFGAKLQPHNTMHLPLSLEGADGLKGGEVELDAASHHSSALLMIAPYAEKPIVIKTNETILKPYIEMTCEMMADFGVLVRRMHRGRYAVPTPQRFIARDYVIEPDLSLAANFFAASAITGGQITIQPIDRQKSKQSEVAFLNILEKMGCVIIENDIGLTLIGPSELKGINADMRPFPTALMPLAAIAPFATSPTTMTNITAHQLKLMRDELKKMGCQLESGHDWLKIYPSDLTAADIDTHEDPRIAMAFAIIGLKIPNMRILRADCVSKLYPDFFDVWDSML